MKYVKLFAALGYSLLLIYIVFFARRRRHLEERYLNLVPFENSIKDFVRLDTNSNKDLYNYYSNLGGNILLFIPLPFVIFSLFKIKSNKTILLVALGLSAFIEFTQYAFKIGVADIDDILLNVLGAIVGIVSLRICRHIQHSMF
ncbi:MAG: VanZ family protein [Hymenobacter sp.]|nr:MAG: VanZ family protein [Hymenobacter sp.]